MLTFRLRKKSVESLKTKILKYQGYLMKAHLQISCVSKAKSHSDPHSKEAKQPSLALMVENQTSQSILKFINIYKGDLFSAL